MTSLVVNPVSEMCDLREAHHSALLERLRVPRRKVDHFIDVQGNASCN